MKNCLARTACIFFLVCLCGLVHAEGLSVDDGVYENSRQFFVLSDNTVVAEVLKSFYGFWYDGPYDVEEPDSPYSLLQVDDGLYLSWWKRTHEESSGSSSSCFWEPCSAVRELALTPLPEKTRITGYFVRTANGSTEIYAVPYWKADVEYEEKDAVLTLEDGSSFAVTKHILIGNTVFTCASGRRTAVRNAESLDSFPYDPSYTSDGGFMVLSEPDYVKADISDLTRAIEAHNAIRYPPRFSTSEIKEPSIYKILAEMKIE